jgi:hypothetical protein
MKDSEVATLIRQSRNMQERMSFQQHTIKDMQSPAYIEPSVTELVVRMRSLLSLKTQLLSASEETEQKNLGKGRDMQDRWQKLSEDNIDLQSRVANGEVQRLRLVEELQQALTCELMIRAKESEEVVTALEDEVGSMSSIVTELQGRLRQALEQLVQLNRLVA